MYFRRQSTQRQSSSYKVTHEARHLALFPSTSVTRQYTGTLSTHHFVLCRCSTFTVFFLNNSHGSILFVWLYISFAQMQINNRVIFWIIFLSFFHDIHWMKRVWVSQCVWQQSRIYTLSTSLCRCSLNERLQTCPHSVTTTPPTIDIYLFFILIHVLNIHKCTHTYQCRSVYVPTQIKYMFLYTNTYIDTHV
jgi:hypothetical protein